MIATSNKPDIEVEYRFEVKEKKDLIRLLDKLSDGKVNRNYQLNVMFDNPLGLMQNTNGRIRIQTTGKHNKVLTYKKPIKTKSSVNKEIEYEIEFVDKNKQIEKILRSVDFAPTTSYERYRTQWSIGKVAVTLDEYPFTDLIEIEGSQKEIKRLSEILGFDPRHGLTKPCDTLFQEWRKERGLSFKPYMRFNDFDK